MSQPTWSHDGKQLFYFRQTESGYLLTVVVRSLETGLETELFRQRTQGHSYMALSPGGRRLAFTNGSRVLRVIPATGGEAQRLYQLPDQHPSWFRGGLAWSRDGERLLFGMTKPDAGHVVQLWQIPAKAASGDAFRQFVVAIYRHEGDHSQMRMVFGCVPCQLDYLWEVQIENNHVEFFLLQKYAQLFDQSHSWSFEKLMWIAGENWLHSRRLILDHNRRSATCCRFCGSKMPRVIDRKHVLEDSPPQCFSTISMGGSSGPSHGLRARC